MELNDYQNDIVTFDLFGERCGTQQIDMAFLDKVLGLTGEAGEVADKVKKLIRDKDGKISEADRKFLSLELGDLLWYLATCARYLGLSLEDVANANLGKLSSRLERDMIGGAGDER
ncbi:MAG: nucleoside triphosphate pyrophosphohydrolase family protein [Streptococcaceae bacterium]|jgi:NTP pyrophosphatase (non-canonical NTP hydrolase)|nr:nucleoside triphosphate pyrophosphohydrolase family protein [Streptococcaceae bacterium]